MSTVVGCCRGGRFKRCSVMPVVAAFTAPQSAGYALKGRPMLARRPDLILFRFSSLGLLLSHRTTNRRDDLFVMGVLLRVD